MSWMSDARDRQDRVDALSREREREEDRCKSGDKEERVERYHDDVDEYHDSCDDYGHGGGDKPHPSDYALTDKDVE